MKKLLIAFSVVTTLLIVFSVSVYANEVKKLDLFDLIDTTWGAISVTANPNGDMLLIQEGYTWDVYLYSINSGVKIQLPTDTRAGMSLGGMRFSFDGSLAAYFSTRGASALDQSTISVVDARSGELIKEFYLNTSSPTLAFDRDNNLIFRALVGSNSDNLKEGITIRNIHTGNAIVEVVGHNSRVLCHSPAQNHFASAGWDNMVRVFDSKSGGSIRTLEFGNDIVSMEYSPDGKYFVVSGNNESILFDVENNYSRMCEFDRGGRVSFNNDSDMLMIGDAVHLIPNGFEQPILIRDGANDVSAEYAFLSPDGKTILNFHHSGNGIRLLDASNISIRLMEIRLEPEVISLISGQELELKLIGINSDRSTRVLDLNDARLIISDFTIARINDNTKIQGLNIGEAELKITYYGMEITKTIKVVSTPPNTDTASTWAREGITNAINKGFVPGDIQNNYANIITRQEFCRMAVKFVEYATGNQIDTILADKGVSRNPNAFTDTTDLDILAAYALGITNGTGLNTFSPNGEFSREQAATMIMNTCNVIGMYTSNSSPARFADMGSASAWALNGINFVQANGIMSGTGNNNFNPKGRYTRQESMVTFDRIK